MKVTANAEKLEKAFDFLSKRLFDAMVVRPRNEEPWFRCYPCAFIASQFLLAKGFEATVVPASLTVDIFDQDKRHIDGLDCDATQPWQPGKVAGHAIVEVTGISDSEKRTYLDPSARQFRRDRPGLNALPEMVFFEDTTFAMGIEGYVARYQYTPLPLTGRQKHLAALDEQVKNNRGYRLEVDALLSAWNANQ